VLGDRSDGSSASSSSSSGGTVGGDIDIQKLIARLGSAAGAGGPNSFSTSSSSSSTVNNYSGSKITTNNIKTSSSKVNQQNQTKVSGDKTISHQMTRGRISISSASSTAMNDDGGAMAFPDNLPLKSPQTLGGGSSSSSSSSSTFNVIGGSLVAAVQVETTECNKITCTSRKSAQPISVPGSAN